MAAPVSEWLTIEETAGWLGVPVYAVTAAIAAGQIPVLRLAEHVRISKTSLLGSVSIYHTVAPPAPSSGPATESLPQPKGLVWLSDLVAAESFSQRWPTKAGDAANISHFLEAWKAQLTLLNEPHAVRIGADHGRTEQKSNDAPDRLFIFFDKVPMVEFMEIGGDHDGWASLIKVNGNKSLLLAEQLPPLYRQARVAPYADITERRAMGRSNGLAVVIARDDLRSCVHHAAARWLARNGHGDMIVPAK